MNKKFLSAILFGAMMATSAGTFVSCKDYDDDIESLSDRISAVEALAKELQAQIQSGAVITNVNKGSNGVVVTLSNGNTFEVTNGAEGKAGSIVTIGENGNWVIDGVDTGKPSQGAKGDKGDQGEQGPAGEQGATGGIAPVYYYPGTSGAEEGYWVKVTTAEDGTETKQVTDIKWAAATAGEQGITAVWAKDKLTLKGVHGAQDETVEIVLTGDLKALVFDVDMVLDGQNAMEYIYVPYKPVVAGEGVEGTMTVHQIVSDSGSDNHATVEKEETYFVGVTDAVTDWFFLNPTDLKEYHMDPSVAILPSWWTAKQELGVVSDDVDFIKTRALANDAAAQPKANYLGVADGVMTIGVTMEGQKVMTQEEEDRYDLGLFYPATSDDKKITDLAVQAPLDAAKKNIITSTYASVYASQMAVEAIAYSTSTYAENYIINEQEYGCEAIVGNAANHGTPLLNGRHLYDLVTDAAEQAPTVELAYNSEDGVNLHQLVTTHVGYNSCRSWNTQRTYTLSIDELKKMGMKYDFEQVNFVIGGNGTEQSQNHSILESKADGMHIVACGVKSLSDTDATLVEPDPEKKAKSYASIGRTPLIRVTLNDTINNQVVKVGYIKFKIVAPEQPITTEEFNLGSFYYSCAAQKKWIAWHAIEDKLLDAARKTSKATFDALYEIDKNELGVVNQYVPAETSVYGQPQYKLADAYYAEDFNRDGFAYEDINNALSKVGVIEEIEDNGAETTDVFLWTVDRADFVWAYEQFTESYPEITITRYVKYNVKKNLGNSNFNAEPVFLPIKITLRYPKGIMANKIAKYWYAENSMNEDNAVLSQEEMEFLHANVEVPATNVEEWGEAQCNFYIDLDSRFEKFEIGHADKNQSLVKIDDADICWVLQENAPSIEVKEEAWDFDWNTESNFPDFVNEKLVYYYFFNTKNNKDVTVDYLNEKGELVEETYTLTVERNVANNPVMLYGITDDANVPNNPLYDPNYDKYEYLNTVLKANGTVIAEISHEIENNAALKPHTGGGHLAVLTILNNEITKKLINDPEAWNKNVTAEELLLKTLDVEIEVAAFNGCGEYLPLVNNTFGVELLKPVYTYANGPIEFTDAHDNGMDMTKVNLADLVTFYDWRQWFFNNFNDVATDDYLSYYNYYGVEDITVHMGDIRTNITGVMKSLKETSFDIEFHLYRDDDNDGTPERVDDGNGIAQAAGVPAATATWDEIVKNFGELRYYNNTGTVVSFDIEVPVRIKHKWSPEPLIVMVKGTVNRTEAN